VSHFQNTTRFLEYNVVRLFFIVWTKVESLVSRAKTLNQFYYLLITLASLAATVRLIWAWPNAPWLSNLWFIETIDSVLSGDLGPLVNPDFGGEHAMIWYTYYLLMSAGVFNFNTHLEIVAYFLFAALISARLVRIVLRSNSARRLFLHMTCLALIVVMLSFVSAGSRGMELGTFFGCSALVLLTDHIFSCQRSKESLLVIFSLALLVYTNLGLYALAWSAAMLTTYLLLTGRENVEIRKKIFWPILAFGLSAASFLMLYIYKNILNNPTGMQSNGLLSEPTLEFLGIFIASGFVASVVSIQTLEVYVGDQPTLVLGIGLLIVVWTFATLTQLLKSIRNCAKPELALSAVLILQGVFQILVLLVGRSYHGELALLQTWYGFHFKLMLCGVILGSFLLLQDSPKHRRQPVLIVQTLIATTIIGSLWANTIQWKRQPHERNYFQQIVIASLDTKQLIESNGVTQLRLNQEQSLEAIRIMKKHELGVFSD
jgi:hypothetical protein